MFVWANCGLYYFYSSKRPRPLEHKLALDVRRNASYDRVLRVVSSQDEHSNERRSHARFDILRGVFVSDLIRLTAGAPQAPLSWRLKALSFKITSPNAHAIGSETPLATSGAPNWALAIVSRRNFSHVLLYRFPHTQTVETFYREISCT